LQRSGASIVYCWMIGATQHILILALPWHSDEIKSGHSYWTESAIYTFGSSYLFNRYYMDD